MNKQDIQTVLDAIDEARTYTSSEAWSPSMTEELTKTIAILQAALAEPEGEPSTVLRLIDTIKYLVGIAERGEGRKARDDELPEQFVLGYVKRLEAALAEPSEAVAWGILASNTGRMCQVELDPEEVAEHNQKYVVPLFTHPASKPEPLSMGAIVLYFWSEE